METKGGAFTKGPAAPALDCPAEQRAYSQATPSSTANISRRLDHSELLVWEHLPAARESTVATRALEFPFKGPLTPGMCPLTTRVGHRPAS